MCPCSDLTVRKCEYVYINKFTLASLNMCTVPLKQLPLLQNYVFHKKDFQAHVKTSSQFKYHLPLKDADTTNGFYSLYWAYFPLSSSIVYCW